MIPVIKDYLTYINIGNNLTQDICHINEEQNQTEGLSHILNEKISNNNDNQNIVNNNNIDINTNDCPPSTTPLLAQP